MNYSGSDVPFTYEIFFHDYFSFNLSTGYRDLEIRLTFQEAMEWRVYRSFLTEFFPHEKSRTSLIKTDVDDRVEKFDN